ncbi:MAG: hypothetical protein PVJ66_07745 [Gammaproteobacteria bacterium]
MLQNSRAQYAYMDDAHGCASVAEGMDAVSDRRRYESRDGPGRAKRDARAESKATASRSRPSPTSL